MDLQKYSGRQLFETLESHFALERQTTYVILLVLREIQNRKIYADIGYPDLFTMMIKKYRQSETAARQRLSALKLMNDVPEAAELLKTGDLNLSVLALAQRKIRCEEKFVGQKISVEKKEEIIRAISGKTMADAEKEIFVLLPESATIPEDHVRRISEDMMRVSLNFPDRLMDKISKLKGRWAAVDSSMGLVEVLELAVDVALDKTEKKALRRTESVAQPVGKRPTYYSVTLDQELWARAGEQCEYIDERTGQRCCSSFGLERDHIVPLARGGTNELSNLRLLCRAHNQLMARRHFGRANVERNYLFSHRRTSGV